MTKRNQSEEDRSSRDLMAIVFAMIFPTIVTLVYFQWLKDSDSSLQQIAFGIGKTIQFGFPALWVWLWHRERIRRLIGESPGSETNGSDVSPTPASSRFAILIGIGFGLIVVGGMFVMYFLMIANTNVAPELSEMVQEKVSDMELNSFWRFVAMGIFYALCHSFLEEYYWRWFVFDMLQKFVSAPTAMIVSSLGFMAHHVILLGFFFKWQWMTYPLSLCIAIGGMFWAWQYQQSGKLRASWISHMIVDAGIFLLGYFIVKSIL